VLHYIRDGGFVDQLWLTSHVIYIDMSVPSELVHEEQLLISLYSQEVYQRPSGRLDNIKCFKIRDELTENSGQLH
jgi:hypothetical protein